MPVNIEFSQALDQLQDLLNDTIRAVPNLLLALFVFLAFYFLSRYVRRAVSGVAERYRPRRNLAMVLGRLSQWFVILLGLLAASVVLFPNFSPAQVIQLLGIGSVAIGFAFRDILQNFLSGILLLITEPFQIGDQIRIGDYEGAVEDIQTRATTLQTYDGRRVLIPNSELYTGSVVVNTAYPLRRVEYDVGIGYGDDIPTAKRLILEALREIDDIVQDPAPDVLVYALADFSVTLRIRWWIRPPRRVDALDSRDQVLERIKDTLLLNGIDLPFPTHQLLLHDQTETGDGDRRQQREGWPAGPGDVPGPRRRPLREVPPA